MKTKPYNSSKNAGFTMIEVLVAMVILAIGLLGVATMQATGLRNNHSAYLRTQASLLGYDMTDRMRANNTGVEAGAYNSISGIPSDPGCITTGCTPAQMAQYDAFAWNTQLAAMLPSGQGTVAVVASIATITVMWDDDRSGATGTGCSGGSSDLKCLQMAIRI